MDEGLVVTQGTPFVTGTVDVPKFDRDGLIAALRADQSGKSTFPEFVSASWRARVVRYDVDFTHEHADTMGVMTKNMSREYPAVDVK